MKKLFFSIFFILLIAKNSFAAVYYIKVTVPVVKLQKHSTVVLQHKVNKPNIKLIKKALQKKTIKYISKTLLNSTKITSAKSELKVQIVNVKKTKNNKVNLTPLFKISEGSTPKLPKNWKKPVLKVKMQVVKQAKINGNYNGLPVLTVDFVNKPLWLMLKNVSNKTGYVFSTKGVNLGKKKSIKGKYNLAVLLSKLFVNAHTIVNIKTKKIKIKG
jgi:hypothetical protein